IARANSMTTSHQKSGRNGCLPETTATIESMMSRETASMASGSRAATRRKMRPNATTPGPESHTMRKTGGTLLSARSRSCQPVQNVRSSSGMLTHATKCDTRGAGLLQTKIEVADNRHFGLAAPASEGSVFGKQFVRRIETSRMKMQVAPQSGHVSNSCWPEVILAQRI